MHKKRIKEYEWQNNKIYRSAQKLLRNEDVSFSAQYTTTHRNFTLIAPLKIVTIKGSKYFYTVAYIKAYEEISSMALI